MNDFAIAFFVNCRFATLQNDGAGNYHADLVIGETPVKYIFTPLSEIQSQHKYSANGWEFQFVTDIRGNAKIVSNKLSGDHERFSDDMALWKLKYG